MSHIEPAADTWEQFTAESNQTGPVFMLNLLRYKDEVEGSPGLTGKQGYQQYGKQAVKLIWKHGGQVIWSGRVRTHLIGPEEGWDEIVLVCYPSRQAFIDMITSAAYQNISPLRARALADSRLIESTPRWLPKPLLMGLRQFYRVTGWLTGK